MFGSAWLDGTLVIVFGAIAVLSLARAALSGGHPGERAGAISHAVMAAGMASMSLPTGDPVPQGLWVLAFGAIATWFAVVLVRLGPASGSVGLSMGRSAWWQQAGPTAHQLVANVFMLLAVGAGGGSHGDQRFSLPGAPSTAEMVGHTGHGIPGSAAAIGLVGSGGPLPAPLTWLFGTGFLAMAIWWTARLCTSRRTRAVPHSPAVPAPAVASSGLATLRTALLAPTVTSVTAIVMTGGMGAMSFTLG